MEEYEPNNIFIITLFHLFGFISFCWINIVSFEMENFEIEKSCWLTEVDLDSCTKIGVIVIIEKLLVDWGTIEIDIYIRHIMSNSVIERIKNICVITLMNMKC